MQRKIINSKLANLSKFTLLIGILVFIPAHAVQLPNQTLRYSVSYGNVNAGEFEVIIESENGQIKSTVISHLSNLAKLFLSGLTAVSWYDISDEQAILTNGQAIDHDSGEIIAEFHADYENKKLTYNNGESTEIFANEVLDSTTFPLWLIFSDVSSIKDQLVREVNSRKVRRYQYLQPEEEILEYQGQKYHTWKVTRRKLDDTNRLVIVWLDKNNHNLPIKIISRKKDKDTTMLLID